MDKVTEAERVLVTFQGEAITGKAEVWNKAAYL
jgi:hypothetical protein